MCVCKSTCVHACVHACIRLSCLSCINLASPQYPHNPHPPSPPTVYAAPPAAPAPLHPTSTQAPTHIPKHAVSSLEPMQHPDHAPGYVGHEQLHAVWSTPWLCWQWSVHSHVDHSHVVVHALVFEKRKRGVVGVLVVSVVVVGHPCVGVVVEERHTGDQVLLLRGLLMERQGCVGGWVIGPACVCEFLLGGAVSFAFVFESSRGECAP